MSQSPAALNDTAGISRYGQSWRDVIELVRSGSSWSGRERNCVYLNTGTTAGGKHNRFANVSAVSGIDFPDDARGLTVVDWDRDGDLDIWLRNRTAPRLRFLRNEVAGGDRNQSVSVKLRGVKCNRDAVGAMARFTSNGTAPPLVRTVRAGDAFLSQSSKWLHFGVGTASAGQIEVRWPSGEIETFKNIVPGRRYVLTQGRSAADDATASAVTIPTDQDISVPTDTAVARIVLPARMPLPLFDWRNDQGESIDNAIPANGQPTLVTLWTSSCPVCCAEISGLAEADERLAASGLNVVGVNIDNLQEAFIPTEFDVSALANANLRLQTTDATISRVVNLQRALFDKYPPFAVPLSFLLDSNANILVIYRGAVGLNKVLEDMDVVSQPNGALRDLAVPFGGSWFTKPASDSEFIEFAAKKLFSKDRQQGLRYFGLAVDAERDTQRKGNLRSQLVSTYRKLGRAAASAGDRHQSETFLRVALRYSNDRERPMIHHDLGVLFATAGDYEPAEQHFRAALRMRPNYPTAKRNLEMLLHKKSLEQ